MTDNNDFKEDELIEIKLPRKQYEILKTMLKRQEAYNVFESLIKSNWFFFVGAGILTIWSLYDKTQAALFGTVK